MNCYYCELYDPYKEQCTYETCPLDDEEAKESAAADIARDRTKYDKAIFMDYCWTDENDAPITKTEREYFEDENALYRRREELESECATIIRFHPPKKPEAPIDKPLIF